MPPLNGPGGPVYAQLRLVLHETEQGLQKPKCDTLHLYSVHFLSLPFKLQIIKYMYTVDDAKTKIKNLAKHDF